MFCIGFFFLSETLMDKLKIFFLVDKLGIYFANIDTLNLMSIHQKMYQG